MIEVLFFLIWRIEGAMLCVNIMVKSSNILKTPSQSFFPNKHGARKDTRKIEINAHQKK